MFADGFDLSKRIEERFGRKCFFLATTRNLQKMEREKTERTKETKRPLPFSICGKNREGEGIDLMLQSMALLKEEELDVHLTVVGRGGDGGMGKEFY